MLIPFEIAAKFLGVGTASGTRAALAMLVVSGLARAGLVEMPASLAFLSSTPWLGALLAATVIEELLERDDDAQQLLAILKYGVHGTGGVVLAWLLIDRFNLPLHGWPVAAIGGAVALLTHNLRMRVHTALAAISAGIVSPRRWLSWLEAGGVIGLTVAAVLSPAIALAFVILASFGAVGLYASFKALEKVRRRPCPTCGSQIRKEARLCPNCKEQLPIGRWVGGGLLERFTQKVAK